MAANNPFATQVVAALSAAGEKRDKFTSIHQNRTAVLADKIIRKLGINRDTAACVQAACLLHDIGKLGVPLDILTKPGSLENDEWQIIVRHSQMGFDIIKSIEFPWDVSGIVLDHHECLDGSGYPNGKKGKEISIGTRIVTVADVAEAITCNRPYRAAMSIDSAIAVLEKGKGTKFDNSVVGACVYVLRDQGIKFGEPEGQSPD